MIKHVFYPILGSSSVESGMIAALQVTEKFRGHVEAICFRRTPARDLVLADEDMNFRGFEDRSKEFIREEKRRVSHARKAFDAVRETHDIAYEQYPEDPEAMTASWEIATGDPVMEVTRRAGVSDLVVVGRTDASVGALTRGLVEAALFAAGAPLLVAANPPMPSLATRVLIGWNRSASAARAIHSALPLLRLAGTVEILAVRTGAKEGPDAQRLAEVLALHGVTATVNEIDPDYRRVGEILRERAAEIDADLLVMGAYSHSRLREFVLGGVTRDILSDAALPVFMAH